MGRIGEISEAEMELMHIIWANGSAMTSAELMERLPENRDWKITTVLTFLSRLAEKGILKVRKKGKANLYSALVTESEYKSSRARGLINRLYGGSVKSFVANLFENDGLSAEEVDELKSWFSKK